MVVKIYPRRMCLSLCLSIQQEPKQFISIRYLNSGQLILSDIKSMFLFSCGDVVTCSWCNIFSPRCSVLKDHTAHYLQTLSKNETALKSWNLTKALMNIGCLKSAFFFLTIRFHIYKYFFAVVGVKNSVLNGNWGPSIISWLRCKKSITSCEHCNKAHWVHCRVVLICSYIFHLCIAWSVIFIHPRAEISDWNLIQVHSPTFQEPCHIIL